MLSCFHEVYAYVDCEDATRVSHVSNNVLDELALNLVLAPHWVIDLTRQWMDIVAASDASEAYGFGMCVASAAPSLVRNVASLSYGDACYVRCASEAGAPPERTRVGSEFRLPFGLSHFNPVLSQKARHQTHSGGLEASAVAQGLRLLSRRSNLHSFRGVFLVNAQAVMHALRKGRSSAPTLRHPLRKCAALSLACDWLWRFQYAPSESNAADWPSRGVVYRRERARQRRRDEQRSNGRVIKYSKYERHLRRLEKAYVALRRQWPSLLGGCDSVGASSLSSLDSSTP